MNNLKTKLGERIQSIKINKAPNQVGFSKKTEQLLNKAQNTYSKEIEKHISPIIELPEDAELCANIADESYKSTKDRQKEIHSYILDEKNSTEDCAIYSNTNLKICVIGYRGTIITNIKDLSSDAQIVLDVQGIDPRVKNSLRRYDTCKRIYQGYSLWVCGHSLGGTLSYIVAKHRNAHKCIVFNPGVSLNTFFFQMIEDTIKKEIWTQNTWTYKIFGDIISTAAFVGHTKVFSIDSKDPLQLHAMENFLAKENSVDNTTAKDK